MASASSRSTSAAALSFSPAALIRTLSRAPSTALLAASAPTPASETELGLPFCAIALSSGKALEAARMVLSGTSVA